MSTFQKQLLEKLHKEFKSDLVSDLGSTSDEDLEDHFIDQLEFRENILSSQQGYINCILEVDESTSKNLSQNLPIDSSRIVSNSKEKIKMLDEVKIATFIEHEQTGAIFVKFFDKPGTDTWDNSEIKELLYSEGITASSLEDAIGIQMPIEFDSNDSEKLGMKDKKLLSVLTDRTVLYFGITENQGEILAVHGGDESDSADTTHVWYAERIF